jgi:hypothetical protein
MTLGQAGNGFVYPGDVSGGAGGAGAAPTLPAAAPGGESVYGGFLGETPLVGGDFAANLAGMGGAALGSLITAQNPWTREGYGGIGQKVGSAAGGMVGGMAAGAMAGSAGGPVGALIGAAAGALGGSFLGGTAGAGIGSQIGPAPTIGRNFGVQGTFNPDGSLSWAGAGGDNRGTEEDALSFANWLAPTLQQQAQAQGLAFNPNMSGVSFNVGGYDQWNRNQNLGGIGGFFYDPFRGDSPELYALRPGTAEGLAGMLGGPGYTQDQAFSQGMANDFTNAVLADLTARGVFTQAGAAQPGRDFFNSTMGSGLGSYGPGMGFNDLFAQAQGNILGQVNRNAWQANNNAQAQRVLGQFYNPGQQYSDMFAPYVGWDDVTPEMLAQTFGTPDGGPPMVIGAGGGLTTNIWSPGAE